MLVARAPTHCLLCRSQSIAVREKSPRYILRCADCGATLAYEPHPPDAPELAGRIEVLVARVRLDRFH
jgi:hypothetical protein